MVTLNKQYSMALQHHSVAPVDAVKWSADNRIAVASQEIVYIFSLNRQSTADSLPATVSLATIPKLPKSTNPLDYKSLLTSIDTVDHSLYLDPALGYLELPSDSCLATEWSPPGCGPNGRCLLGCLTQCGRCYVFAPPTLVETNWKMTFSVSNAFKEMLEAVNYNMEHIIPSNGTIPNNDSPTQAPPTKTTPTTSTKATPTPLINKRNSNKGVAELLRQSASLSMTALSWLPVTMVTVSGERCLLLAVSTRSGHVTLCSFTFDSNGAHRLCPLLIIKLDSCYPNHWPNMLNFISIGKDYLLIIGYTNGTMDYIHWTTPTAEWTPKCFSKPHPVTPLWPIKDNIPVDMVTWCHAPQNGGLPYCVFAKGVHTIILPVDLARVDVASNDHTPSSLLRYMFATGYHKSTITGLSVLPNNTLITCSTDGVLQSLAIPAEAMSRDCHVTGEGCHVTDVSSSVTQIMLGQSKHIERCHGMAVSENSFFICLAINFSSVHKLSCPSEIQLHSLASSHPFSKTIETSWDLYEHHRFNPSLTEEACPNLRLQWYNQQLFEVPGDTDVLIMAQHAREFLSEFQRFKTKDGVDVSSLTSLDKLSLYNICQLLLSYCTEDPQLINEMSGVFPDDDCVETCCICNEAITFSCYHGDSCAQGHHWKRCVLTQCLIMTASKGLICSMCGSHALSYNHMTSGSWLSWLLKNVFQCPLCGGYFDSFV